MDANRRSRCGRSCDNVSPVNKERIGVGKRFSINDLAIEPHRSNMRRRMEERCANMPLKSGNGSGNTRVRVGASAHPRARARSNEAASATYSHADLAAVWQ